MSFLSFTNLSLVKIVHRSHAVYFVFQVLVKYLLITRPELRHSFSQVAIKRSTVSQHPSLLFTFACFASNFPTTQKLSGKKRPPAFSCRTEFSFRQFRTSHIFIDFTLSSGATIFSRARNSQLERKLWRNRETLAILVSVNGCPSVEERLGNFNSRLEEHSVHQFRCLCHKSDKNRLHDYNRRHFCSVRAAAVAKTANNGNFLRDQRFTKQQFRELNYDGGKTFSLL
jgi:hypothetical protein